MLSLLSARSDAAQSFQQQAARSARPAQRTPAQGPAAPRRMGKLYQVIVNGLKGEKMTVDLGHSESDNLESIRLIFTTKQLEDSSKLSEYSIQDKSVIQMVLRLPGGQQD
ncbi:hypothetical protein JZ751_022524 [Albula glossodonta]|uniref:Ubiquitin-like domain-containing protein n=1 Tax=Albula glossodonta TaxID=121402 RepID=A0A8T2MRC7_9TELE|nr:hypothetical protein JZ751_022524 [Albula glossodonta]